MSYAIQLPKGSGKACNGCAKTISLQVIETYPGGYSIKKLFRFKVGDKESMRRAYAKAHAYKNQLEQEAETPATNEAYGISGGEHDCVKQAIAQCIRLEEGDL